MNDNSYDIAALQQKFQQGLSKIDTIKRRLEKLADNGERLFAHRGGLLSNKPPAEANSYKMLPSLKDDQ